MEPSWWRLNLQLAGIYVQLFKLRAKKDEHDHMTLIASLYPFHCHLVSRWIRRVLLDFPRHQNLLLRVWNVLFSLVRYPTLFLACNLELQLCFGGSLDSLAWRLSKTLLY